MLNKLTTDEPELTTETNTVDSAEITDWSKVDFKLVYDERGLPIPHLGNPDCHEHKEYIVTLHNEVHSEDFLAEMLNVDGTEFIPNREVECLKCMKFLSHHMISGHEAKNLINDSRVKYVELHPKERGASLTTESWSTTGTFSKAFTLTQADENWGIYRTLIPNNVPNWGSGSNELTIRTVTSQLTGKNVDVVIWDQGSMYPYTHEIAQNSDGTGYSRFVQYEWNTYYGDALDSPTYYMNAPNFYSRNVRNDHCSHTAGTVAGNTKGFARDANVYGGNFDRFPADILHSRFSPNKAVNPTTGIKNPTVTSNSYGFSYNPIYANTLNISQINYRGTAYYPTSGTFGSYVWDETLLESVKIPKRRNAIPARNYGYDDYLVQNDIKISKEITVFSAGNSFWYVDTPDGPDYNNWLYIGAPGSGTQVYYNQGSSPGAAVDTTAPLARQKDYAPILVGSYGAVTTGQISADSTTVRKVYGWSGYTTATGLLAEDYKSEFSNYGPGVDVYAPGECIVSVGAPGVSAYLGGKDYAGNYVVDPRVSTLSNTFKTDSFNNVFARDAGTSMACPHVAGVIACMLEENPTWTQLDVRNWLYQNSKPTLQSTSGGVNDGTDAAINSNSPNYSPSAKNLILNLYSRSTATGPLASPWPPVKDKARPSSSAVYPRPKIRNQKYQPNVSFSMSTTKQTISTTSKAGSNAGAIWIDGSSSQGVFGGPYYGQNWVDVSTNTSSGFFGTGSWTFETFVYFYQLDFTDQNFLISGLWPNINNIRIGIENVDNNYDKFRFSLSRVGDGFTDNFRKITSNMFSIYAGGTNPLARLKWHHLAIVSNNGVASIYLNGILISTPTDISNWWGDDNTWIAFGKELYYRPIVNQPITVSGLNPESNWLARLSIRGPNIILSNTRICKGVAVYTGNFTVPTVALTPTQSSSTNISAITGNQCTLLTFNKFDSTGNTCSDSSNFSSTNILLQQVLTVDPVKNANGDPTGSAKTPAVCDPGSHMSYQVSPFGDSTVVNFTSTNVPNGTKVNYIISARPKSTSQNDGFNVFGQWSIDVPMVGTLTFNDNTASLPITFYTTDSVWVNVRLDFYGTPSVTLSVN